MAATTLAPDIVINNALWAALLSRRLGNQLSAHGISLNEYLILHCLASSPQRALARVDLAEKLAISASGITRLVAPMEKIGLVEKQANPRDARQSLVRLSAGGEGIYKDASVTFAHGASDSLGRLSRSEQRQLLDLQQKVLP